MNLTKIKNIKKSRIDVVLYKLLKLKYSRNKIQEIIKNGYVYLNNENKIKCSKTITKDDKIKINFDFKKKYIDFDINQIIPENIPINIVYQDNDMIVLNKSAGLVIHPGNNNLHRTLLNGLQYYYKQNNIKIDTNMKRLGLVHRIDKNTSGLVICAKNSNSFKKLSHQFYTHSVKRKYKALVWGNIKNNFGTINCNIGRNLNNRTKMSCYPNNNYGKKSITNYKIIKRFYNSTFISCQLHTGRTHQIRVHLKYLGHPIFNDDKYGGNKILFMNNKKSNNYVVFIKKCFSILSRQALHAYSISLLHPKNYEKMYFYCALPYDLRCVLGKWQKFYNTVFIK